MQKTAMLFLFLGLLVLLGGCTENIAKEPASTKNSSSSGSGANIDDDAEAVIDEPINEKKESAPKEADSSSVKSGDPKDIEKSGADDDSSRQTDSLNSYSTEEIEYARVWAQLGPNQEIDELNIRHIPPGEPVNPNIDNSAVYPEGVIQLSGSRLVDGSVTYRGNGDGTIHVYATPMRWEAPPPGTDEKELQKDTEDILNNTKLVSIEPRDGQEIISLIEKLVFR
ncbi:hypothetical protein [Metabacillus sp. cB07]|uniref:hypothetical protein n=1 Tax=Metabacillus sp. cB07 TaxID=2806989 RepID=UPI00193A9F4D|nr:hypothetical protein [Metabacillus sp. cB07]